MEQEYIYGVARIRALEGSLFTDETINQLVQCKDYDEAMDFLRTKGWGNGNPDQSLEEMLEQERRRTWKVLDELIEDKEQCEILTIANEYHNLKAAIKHVCTELETENVFYEDTKTDTEFLKNCIRQGNYNLLPKGMEQAAKDATTVLMQTGDGQLCDVIIDRATLEAIKQAGLTTVFVIVTVTLLMSDVTSNTATAAVAIPIVISIVKGMGLNPIPYVYVASVGVNLSYMLPTSIRAIPVGYGLQPKYMLKEGWKMTVFIIVSMTIVCTLLLKFWPAFSTV